jgi:hypothetical protein
MRKAGLLLVIAFLLAACGPPPPAPMEPQSQKFTQPLLLRVLDSMDRPVASAKVELKGNKGVPIGASKTQTDKNGEVAISWSPQVVDHTAGTKSRDEVFDLVSQAEFTITKKGFFPAQGLIKAEARGRRIYDPKLKALGSEPVISTKSETVVLRRLGEVLGGDLRGKPLSDPLVSRLMKFHQSMALVVPHLGLDFSWPAFVTERNKLTLKFDLRSASWATLGHAPLLGKVTAGALLPLARAVGEELSGLPGVSRIALQVLSETTPPDDPYALPTVTRVTLTAPQAAYSQLAANRVSPDELLHKYPPSMAVEKPPRSAGSAPKAPEHGEGKKAR